MKFARSSGLARILIIRILNKPSQGGYAMETYKFLEALNETNKANEMAFRYAVLILEDFSNLSQEGRRVMTDTLMELISGKREEPDIKTYNLPGWKI